MARGDKKADPSADASLPDDTEFGELADPAQVEVNDVTAATPDPAEMAAAVADETTEGVSLGRSPTPAFPAVPAEPNPLVWADEPPAGASSLESSLDFDDTPLHPVVHEPSARQFGPVDEGVPAVRLDPPSRPLMPAERSRRGYLSPPQPFDPPVSSPSRFDALIDTIRHVGATLADLGEAAVARFERLPRWQQMLCVAAPYVLTLVVIARLLFPGTTSVDVTIDSARTLEGLTPGVGPSDGVSKASVAKPTMRTKVVALRRRTALYVRPNNKARRATPLGRQQVITIYPDFPSPAGWVLARSEKGTVGFILTRHLAEEPLNTAKEPPRRRIIQRDPPSPPP